MAKKTIVTPEMDGVGYIDGGSVNDEIMDMWHQLRRENGVDGHKSIETPFHELGRKGSEAIVWTATMIDDLKNLSRTAFAAKYSMARCSATKKRKELGIPSRQAVVLTQEMIDDLGEITDVEFSEKYKIAKPAVFEMRKQRGIYAFNDSRRCKSLSKQ